ncbi:MAG: YdcF family protein, partial [Gemmatimonadaceae bacterium]|nr:YdcF family protein [Gemmatimonadaceae bacterium]
WLVNFLAVALLTAAVATPDLARQFTRRLVRDDALPKDGVQAVVVLSALLNADGQLDGVGADRLLTGLGLVKKLGTPILITTRYRLPEDPAISTEGDQGRLIALAGLRARWIVTREVFDTRDEAQATAAIAQREGFTRIAVVTSPLHTKRACALFEREKLAVTCVAATSRDAAFKALKSPGDRVRAVRLGVYETAAWGYSRVRGWL